MTETTEPPTDGRNRSAVTNLQVAEDLGFHHSLISRVRNSQRLPGYDLMVRIAQVYGWSLDSQHSNKRTGYAEPFEMVLRDHYGR